MKIGDKHFAFMKGASEYIVDISDHYIDFSSEKNVAMSKEIKD